MSDTAHKPQHLPQGLTATVGVVQEILGEVVAAVEGRELFEVVESVRRDMVAFREAATEDDGSAALDRAASRLEVAPGVEISSRSRLPGSDAGSSSRVVAFSTLAP